MSSSYISNTFLLLIYLGGLNLAFYTLAIVTLPILPKEVAVCAKPCDIEEPALNVAVMGAEMAPSSPDPNPLNNPLAPSSLVF